MRRLAGFLVSLALAVAPVAAGANPPTSFTFSVPTPAGGTISSDDFRGKVLIVDVWASWCEPCRIAAPHFVKLHAKYKSRGVAVMGLSADHEGTSTMEDIKGFIDQFGITYPVGLLNKETFDKLVELSGEAPESFTIPTTILLDRDGKLLRLFSGYSQGQVLEIENIIASLIEPEKSAERKSKN